MFLITLNFQKFSRAKGKFFIYERLYYKGYKWTPICIIKPISRLMEQKDIDDIIASALYDYTAYIVPPDAEVPLYLDKLKEFFKERGINHGNSLPIEKWEIVKKDMKLFLDNKYLK